MTFLILDLLLIAAGQRASTCTLTGMDSISDFLAPCFDQLLVGVLLDPSGFLDSWRRLLGRQDDDPDKAVE